MTTVTANRPFHPLSLLCEAAVLLWTASLLLLPWFRDPSPPAGISPHINAGELIAHGYHGVIVAYLLALLAYALARFGPWKPAGMIPLLAAGLVYLSVSNLGFEVMTTNLPSRSLSSIEALNGFPPAVGVIADGFGVITLALGLLAGEARPLRAYHVLFATLAFLLGLLIISGIHPFILIIALLSAAIPLLFILIPLLLTYLSLRAFRFL